MLSKLLPIASILLLFGCATTQEFKDKHYEEPSKSNLDISFIEGSSNGKALLDIQYYSIAAIDGKPILPPAYRDLLQDGIRVSEGEHEFVFLGETNGKSLFDPCPCRAFWKTNFKIESGKHYLLKGKVQDKKMQFWIIEENTGERKTETVEREYKPFSSGAAVYIPVT